MGNFRFGFLCQKVTYDFVGGTIAPLPGFGDGKKWIAHYAHKEGFLYPPIVESRNEKGETVANTRRPAHLHRVPPSHELNLGPVQQQEDRSRPHASLIIHLVGYLHGTCVQFEDWWFDARVPLGEKHNIHFVRKTAEHFLSHAYTTWRQWPQPVRRRFTNILFMLNRAPSYESDWEHFLSEYMVLDACHRTAEDLGVAPKRGGHAERIDRLCRVYNLMQNPGLTREIVRMRNDLFHEALWDRGQPGTATTSGSPFFPLHLRRLNQRLVLALLSYQNDYMRSGWWAMGTSNFGIP
jgi:hypothetical protein